MFASKHALLPVCSVCRKFCGQDFLPRVAEVFFRALAHRARLPSCPPPGGIFVVGQDDFALNFSDQVLRRTKTRQISRMGKLLTHLTSVGDLGFSQCCSAWRSSPACTRKRPHPPAPACTPSHLGPSRPQSKRVRTNLTHSKNGYPTLRACFSDT